MADSMVWQTQGVFDRCFRVTEARIENEANESSVNGRNFPNFSNNFKDNYFRNSNFNV